MSILEATIRTLQECGFVLESYDRLLRNKIIEEKQCTVEKNHNVKFIKECPLKSSREIDYRQSGKVKLAMYEYIKKMMEEFPLDKQGRAKTPATSFLSNTIPGSKKLSEEQWQLFHHLVAKLLCLSKCIRQYIQTAVERICIRVKNPDIGDYKKLTRVMKHLPESLTVIQKGRWIVHTQYIWARKITQEFQCLYKKEKHSQCHADKSKIQTAKRLI